MIIKKVATATQVCMIYKKICQGEDLEKIKAPPEVKELIVNFSKCPITMSAHEISKFNPAISADLASRLRHIRKIERRNKFEKGGSPRTIGLGETVRQVSLGVSTADIKKAGGTAVLCKRANRFISMALKNKPVAVIAAQLSLSEYTAKTMLGNFDKNYRKFYESKEEKIILEA